MLKHISLSTDHIGPYVLYYDETEGYYTTIKCSSLTPIDSNHTRESVLNTMCLQYPHELDELYGQIDFIITRGLGYEISGCDAPYPVQRFFGLPTPIAIKILGRDLERMGWGEYEINSILAVLRESPLIHIDEEV